MIRAPVQRDYDKYRENLYSNATLIGNWCEDRYSVADDKKAILPGIGGKSECIKDKSEYKSCYDPKLDKMGNDFFEWKHNGYYNKRNSGRSNIQMWTGRLLIETPFLNNMTTMTDLKYRIEPARESYLIDEHSHPWPTKMTEDTLRPLGNQTNYGLVQAKKCEERAYRRFPTYATVYKETFVPKWVKVQRNFKPLNCDTEEVRIRAELKRLLRNRECPQKAIAQVLEEEKKEAELYKLPEEPEETVQEFSVLERYKKRK